MFLYIGFLSLPHGMLLCTCSRQAGSPREGILSKQQAALAHSWLSWLCLNFCDRAGVASRQECCFPPRWWVLILLLLREAVAKAPAESCCQQGVLSCPGCPLMEAHPDPQWQGWALPTLGTGHAMSCTCPCNALPCRGHWANLESPSWLFLCRSFCSVECESRERGWMCWLWWVAGKSPSSALLSFHLPLLNLLHRLSLSENPKSLLSASKLDWYWAFFPNFPSSTDSQAQVWEGRRGWADSL